MVDQSADDLRRYRTPESGKTMTTARKPTAKDASKTLHAKFGDKPWWIMSGTGTHEGVETVFVYVTVLREANKLLPSECDGFPVFVRRMERPRPA